MIIAKQPIIDYIRAKPSITGFAQEVDVTPQTIHNLMNGKNVSSELFCKLMDMTGFEFEKAFEIKVGLGKD